MLNLVLSLYTRFFPSRRVTPNFTESAAARRKEEQIFSKCMAVVLGCMADGQLGLCCLCMRPGEGEGD